VAYSLSPFQRSKQTRPAPTPPGGHQPTLTPASTSKDFVAIISPCRSCYILHLPLNLRLMTDRKLTPASRDDVIQAIQHAMLFDIRKRSHHSTTGTGSTPRSRPRSWRITWFGQTSSSCAGRLRRRTRPKLGSSQTRRNDGAATASGPDQGSHSLQPL